GRGTHPGRDMVTLGEPVMTGGVIVELGARRRWPFRREGPNGSALLFEVGTLDSSHPSMLPSPLRLFSYMFPMLPSPYGVVCTGFGAVLGRTVPGCPSAENVTCIEVAMMLRPDRPPQHHRDMVATALDVTIVSRRPVASRPRCVATTAEIGETSQQQEGARRAEETGRRGQARELIEQQDESNMLVLGHVQEEMSVEEEHGSLGRQQREVSLQYLPQRYRSSRQIRRWSSQQFSRRQSRQCDFFFFGLGQFGQFRSALKVQTDDYSRGWTESETKASVEVCGAVSPVGS
ncbi:hypothetical protein Taro_052772, partial [Colocasia esculenta]|nr:hypothetical protein [Colocasia esculenta]